MLSTNLFSGLDDLLVRDSLKPLTSLPCSLAFYPFQFSWLGYLESLGGLFILIDTYWIHERRIRWLRNKSWILSGSFHTSEESQPAEEKLFHSYKSLFGDFMCFRLESELPVVNNMNFLLSRSENIPFRLHMLTFSVLKMWVSKWPFTFLLQEALCHSPEELFICRLIHSLGFLDGQRGKGILTICRLSSLVSSVIGTSGSTVMTVTRPSLQGQYNLT